MRRNTKKLPVEKLQNDPGGTLSHDNNEFNKLGVAYARTRPRANSADIAEERGPPTYPSAKKSEGKILRPQYKEILCGQSSFG